MSVTLFSALNFGIGIAFGLVVLMINNHLKKGYRFSTEQEKTVLRLVRIMAFGLFVNLVMSGLLGTVNTFAHITERVPMLAIIPLAGKLVGGFGLWLLIGWIIRRFYPTQKN